MELVSDTKTQNFLFGTRVRVGDTFLFFRWPTEEPVLELDDIDGDESDEDEGRALGRLFFKVLFLLLIGASAWCPLWQQRPGLLSFRTGKDKHAGQVGF